MFSSGEHDQLAKLKFNPLSYSNEQDTRDAYFASKFLSKYKGFNIPDLDLKAVAIAKFRETELRCKVVNRHFRSVSGHPMFGGDLVWLHNAVRRKISQILGDFDAAELFESPDWGPGASTLIRRLNASPQQKFRCETGITRDLYDLFTNETFEASYPHWFSHLSGGSDYPSFQVGNKIITVPKDASTDRVIAIEPGINLWFQKSIGEMIRRRLLGFGVDLRHQERNQQLARSGSKTSELTTVDFSSASDTISSAVVEELLPPRWFWLLDSCRSHFGLLEGQAMKWEKFSSMGNGFTFPLETLIFHACALACVDYVGADPNQVSTYGDDVVLPSPAFELYSRLVEFYGFSVNFEKSHSLGSFRESCGAHYYRGRDIKPVYFRNTLVGIETVYRLYNAIRRLAKRQGVLCCDERFRSVADLLLFSVPKALRLRIPDGFGDGGFISNFDEATPSRLRGKHSTHEGYSFRQYGTVNNTYVDEGPGYFLAELWRLSRRSASFDSGTVKPGGFLIRTPVLPCNWLNLMYNLKNPLALLEAIQDAPPDGDPLVGRNTVPTHRTSFRLLNSRARQWHDLGPWL
jgi:hypothetical protein